LFESWYSAIRSDSLPATALKAVSERAVKEYLGLSTESGSGLLTK